MDSKNVIVAILERKLGALPPAHFVTPSAQLPSLRFVQPVPREVVTPFAPPLLAARQRNSGGCSSRNKGQRP